MMALFGIALAVGLGVGLGTGGGAPHEDSASVRAIKMNRETGKRRTFIQSNYISSGLETIPQV